MFHNCTNVCTLEVVQTEDSLVSIDFSLTVDLLVEFGHILVSSESNMNSMLDSYSLLMFSNSGFQIQSWKHAMSLKSFLIELAMDSNQLVTLNFASVDFEFDELAIEYVLNQGFSERQNGRYASIRRNESLFLLLKIRCNNFQIIGLETTHMIEMSLLALRIINKRVVRSEKYLSVKSLVSSYFACGDAYLERLYSQVYWVF